MDIFQKMLAAITPIVALLAEAMAHTEANDTHYGPGMMWSDGGSWMYNGAHMMGYNMWGMGWFGFIPGILSWILVILGMIFLYQKITENREAETGNVEKED
ncbi:MAG: hypothetical protein ABEJ99_00890 [Candidatus Nanohaloarchaea archaeon]